MVENISPLENQDFEGPTLDETGDIQERELPKRMNRDLTNDVERLIWVDKRNRIWIPVAAISLQKRLCVLAHAGSAGHRGMDTTLLILSKHVAWNTMESDVREFVKKCLHCMVANGEMCPRPYGETLRATKPNEILHSDFLTMPKGLHGFCYVLVSKDGMSGFCELLPERMANTEVAVQVLLDWFKRYGAVLWWVSDQGSHFKNEIMEHLRKMLGAQHHFVTAYCPWANGTVEVMNRQLLKVMRSLPSERKQRIGCRPTLLSLYKSTLTQLPPVDLVE